MSGSWSAMTALGPSAKQIAVGADNTSKLALFYVGQDNSINWCVRTAASTMTAAAIGGTAQQIAVVQHIGGWNELFYIALDGTLWHNWQDATTGFFWVGGQPMPILTTAGPLPPAPPKATQMAVALCSDGTADLVYIGPDSMLYHMRQFAPYAQDFGENLSPLGASAKAITLVQDVHGALHLFYIAPDNALYHATQSGRDWAAGVQVASSVGCVAAANDANGILTLAYAGLGSAVYVQPLTASGWGGGQVIGGANCSPVTEIAAILNSDGTLEVFYAGASLTLWHNRQTTPPNWGSETALSGDIRPAQMVVGVEPEGYAHVFALGSGGEIEHWLDNASAAYVCGSPPGVPLSGLVGASHIGDVVSVYAVGIDGNLWGRATSVLGAVWQKQGTVSAALAQSGNNSANATVPVGSDLWLFACDTSGKLCTAIWTPAGWTWGEIPGMPPTYSPIVAVKGALATPTVNVYATDASGAGWAASWMADPSTGLGWKWNSAVSPAFGTTTTIAWTHEEDPMSWGTLGSYIEYYATCGQEGSNSGTVYGGTTQWITLNYALMSGNIICEISAGTV